MQYVRPFLNSKIFILSNTSEKAQYAQSILDLHGWENEVYTHPDELLSKIKSNDRGSVFLVILISVEQDLTTILERIKTALFPESQTIVGTSRSSSRLKLISEYVTVDYSEQPTPMGPKVVIHDLARMLLKSWRNSVALILPNQIKTMTDMGTIGMVAATSNTTVGVIKEKAHIAFSIANSLNASITALRRTAKLAIISSLNNQQKEKVVKEARYFWELAPLLIPDSKNNIETAAVALAELYIQERDNSYDTFQAKAVEYLENSPFETRVAVLEAVDICIKPWWGKQNAA